MDGCNRHDRLCAELRVLAETVARAAGVEVVDLRVRGSSDRRIVRVDIDRPGPTGVTLADCQSVSVELGHAIDDSGTLDEGYVLEVSSPGADRPIRTADDVRRNLGRRVEIVTRSPIEGRREFRGVLAGVVDDSLCLVDDTSGEVRIQLEHVALARQEMVF
jgi:ribosome maturation factor RimP